MNENVFQLTWETLKLKEGTEGFFLIVCGFDSVESIRPLEPSEHSLYINKLRYGRLVTEGKTYALELTKEDIQEFEHDPSLRGMLNMLEYLAYNEGKEDTNDEESKPNIEIGIQERATFELTWETLNIPKGSKGLYLVVCGDNDVIYAQKQEIRRYYKRQHKTVNYGDTVVARSTYYILLKGGESIIFKNDN